MIARRRSLCVGRRHRVFAGDAVGVDRGWCPGVMVISWVRVSPLAVADRLPSVVGRSLGACSSLPSPMLVVDLFFGADSRLLLPLVLGLVSVSDFVYYSSSSCRLSLSLCISWLRLPFASAPLPVWVGCSLCLYLCELANLPSTQRVHIYRLSKALRIRENLPSDNTGDKSVMKDTPKSNAVPHLTE